MDIVKELPARSAPELGTFPYELSKEELEYVAGGKKYVYKYDSDGDGKWDEKLVIKY